MGGGGSESESSAGEVDNSKNMGQKLNNSRTVAKAAAKKKGRNPKRARADARREANEANGATEANEANEGNEAYGTDPSSDSLCNGAGGGSELGSSAGEVDNSKNTGQKLNNSRTVAKAAAKKGRNPKRARADARREANEANGATEANEGNEAYGTDPSS